VAVVIFVMPVGVTMTVIFVIVEAAVVANFAILIPMMVVVKVAARAVPIAGIETAAIVARSNPTSASVRGTAPITFVPAIVSTHRIPIAFDPHEIGRRLRGHDDDGSRGWWRADLNANGNLGLCGRTCQQKRRKCGSLEQMFHKSVRLLEQGVAGLVYIPR
jgi:hypothetical protein